MDNSFFIFTEKGLTIEIERFHICTWEFQNDSSFIEFGCEIKSNSLQDRAFLELSLFIPWLTQECKTQDFYPKLKDSANSRFIFNDSVYSTVSLDGGRNLNGVVHEFGDRKNKLCILPIKYDNNCPDNTIDIQINLASYNKVFGNVDPANKPNVYVRFSVSPKNPSLATKKNGIGKSTIIYDIKLNERRNMTENLLQNFGEKELCAIETCFCLNIVPNRYDVVFFDNSSLQNIRTLEHKAFNSYLVDNRIKKDELIVVFSKKKKGTPFSFFAIYSKERIGMGQFALAIFLNMFCGILLFIPSYRTSQQPPISFFPAILNLPKEVYLAISIAFITLFYFTMPVLRSLKFRK